MRTQTPGRAAPSPSTGDARRPSVRPTLRHHGDVTELTKSEYGGLDVLVHGSVFAMSSPGLPGTPGR